ncbi:MAG: anti-sigma factor family protein [Planctomycetota bacterium]|jgi:anti-sigma factor RsiW
MSDSPTANTIRLYCDGELPRAEAEQVEAQVAADPKLRARVDFERRLREHVGEALHGAAAAPLDLADRVRTTVRQADPVAGRVGVLPEARPARRPWWHAPRRANVFAVAASLTLVTAAVLFGIFGRPIDSWRGRSLVDVAAAAAAAVAVEHQSSTLSLGFTESGMPYRTIEETRKGLAPFVGGPAGVFDLRGVGYEFVGGSKCRVPHCEDGCHLYYRRVEGSPGLVSLHIVPDRGQFTLRGEAKIETLPLATDIVPENAGCSKDVLVWTHDNLSYLLVVCVSEDLTNVARRMQEALLAGGAAP